MIKVLYDHQKFSGQQYGGISRYFANLLAGAKANPKFEASVSMLYNQNHYLNHLSFPMENLAGKAIFGTKPSRITKWNKQYSRYRIGKNDFDLLHPTYYHPYFLKGLRKPYVITVHDMIYELLPEHFLPTEKLMVQKQITISGAAGIIAISESTKRDLMQVLNVLEHRIKVIHHGISPQYEVAAVPGLPEIYLLFVGERANYKNFDSLLKCFAKLHQQYPDLYLVCAGGGAFGAEELQLQKDLHVQAYCKQLNAIDAQLNYLYQQAEAFVFPSLYEGFGYPLLEAFMVGCAVVAGNSSSFPEVGGDAIHYFDLQDRDSMYKAIDEVLNHIELKEDLIKKGYERLKLFPLQREIDETLDYYKQVINA